MLFTARMRCKCGKVLALCPIRAYSLPTTCPLRALFTSKPVLIFHRVQAMILFEDTREVNAVFVPNL
ncbi:hypothetical protein PAECIP111891_04499 [Paenibacillus allorhizoplanae]|uniref:Uncharacterized protein n=1 Tax=Paenibacillus allorhizoplanae TaxID=2905648 RepID=A0ABM9CLI7_9BACL|nr:hypothetical protein PAECIP111891_04499 [Paenibacillus allorhizoplanae]